MDALQPPVHAIVLPPEILHKILESVSTEDLLHKCRLVSKSWYQASSRLCHFRRVRVNSLKFFQNRIISENMFEDVENLPWSRISLTISTGYLGSTVNRQIAGTFGTKIRSLTLHHQEPNYDNLLTVLSSMPNLQNITLWADTPSNPPIPRQFLDSITEGRLKFQWLFPTGDEIKLHNLDKIFIQLTDLHSVNFLEFLLVRTGCNLRSMSLRLDTMAENDFVKVVQLLTNGAQRHLKETRLRLKYNGPTAGWKFLAAQKNLSVQDLDITSTNVVTDDHYFRPLQHFLANCSSSVGKLALTGFMTSRFDATHRDRPPIPVTWKLQLPQFPSLSELHLCCPDGDMEYSEPPPGTSYIQFQALTPKQFPKLERVTMGTHKSFSTDGCCRPMFSSTRNDVFSSVKFLEIRSYNDPWADVFPNVTELSTSVQVSLDLELIFEMRHLRKLDITFDICSEVNVIVPECFDPAPDLPELEKLTVGHECVDEDTDPDTIMNDESASLFLLLRPLDLTIRDGNLSDDCIAQLRSHHLRVDYHGF